MNCILKGYYGNGDTIVINKADGDNIRKAQLAKMSSTERYIYFQQKIRLDSQLQPAVQLPGIGCLGNHHNLSNSRKAMIILIKKRLK
jgi:hypothetical protein